MKINKIKIEGVGGIINLELEFNTKLNLFCGPNGIGKTTIIEVIAHLFSNGRTNILKRNVNVESSKIRISIEQNGEIKEKEISFNTFSPERSTIIKDAFHDLSKNIISLKANRLFKYKPLQSVSKDTIKNNNVLWSEASSGVNLQDTKNWFVNRYLYSAHEGALTEELLDNYKLAKSCFSLLDNSFAFSKVNATSNEIMVNTPNGEIYYEYLSSGFKSIISILFGIIKEIEFRFTDERITALKFDGIILIDEIGLHLHPSWQEKIITILQHVFPNSQIFATTHSPHIIQHATPKQIIALELIDNQVRIRELPESKYGFQGWTIEEVLTDVMGMADTRTDLFNGLIKKFQDFIDTDNYESANEIYTQINSILHPNNNLSKLLKFQLAAIQ